MLQDRKIDSFPARPCIFQPEILQAGAVKGLKGLDLKERGIILLFISSIQLIIYLFLSHTGQFCCGHERLDLRETGIIFIIHHCCT